jgi:hypothetical protein
MRCERLQPYHGLQQIPGYLNLCAACDQRGSADDVQRSAHFPENSFAVLTSHVGLGDKAIEGGWRSGLTRKIPARATVSSMNRKWDAKLTPIANGV